jgi:hypothetical protein
MLSSPDAATLALHLVSNLGCRAALRSSRRQLKHPPRRRTSTVAQSRRTRQAPSPRLQNSNLKALKLVWSE